MLAWGKHFASLALAPGSPDIIKRNENRNQISTKKKEDKKSRGERRITNKRICKGGIKKLHTVSKTVVYYTYIYMIKYWAMIKEGMTGRMNVGRNSK